MKIVVNGCYGGFDLSQEAIDRLKELGVDFEYGCNEEFGISDDAHRHAYRCDERLVKVVEELGSRANGTCGRLRVADVPDDVVWFIDDYDGIETVREKHRTW